MLHHTNLVFDGKLEKRSLMAIDSIILHHSEVSTPHTVQDVHNWHKKKKTKDGGHWAGIGYHFFISKDGEIYEGRPLDTIGAHTYGHNAHSVGVCFEGNFNVQKMTDKQLDGSVLLLSLLLLACDIGMEMQKACDLVKNITSPGKFFPFDKLCIKVEECKKLLRSVYGHPYEIDDDREERGNFEYVQLVELFKEIRD